MSLKEVDMENCFKKERCLSGENIGLAYTPGDECEQGFVFNDETCDCESTETAYVWIEVQNYLDCLGPTVPEGWETRTSYIPRGPDCFKSSSLSLSFVRDLCLINHPTKFEDCATTVYPIIECKNTYYDYTWTITPCNGEPYFVSGQLNVKCGTTPIVGGGDVVPDYVGDCP